MRSGFNTSARCFVGLQKSAPTNLRTSRSVDELTGRHKEIDSCFYMIIWDRMGFFAEPSWRDIWISLSRIKRFVENDSPSNCIQKFLTKTDTARKWNSGRLVVMFPKFCLLNDTLVPSNERWKQPRKLCQKSKTTLHRAHPPSDDISAYLPISK